MSEYGYKKWQCREQISLIQTSLDEIIDVDNPVRTIDKILNRLFKLHLLITPSIA